MESPKLRLRCHPCHLEDPNLPPTSIVLGQLQRPGEKDAGDGAEHGLSTLQMPESMPEYQLRLRYHPVKAKECQTNKKAFGKWLSKLRYVSLGKI